MQHSDNPPQKQNCDMLEMVMFSLGISDDVTFYIVSVCEQHVFFFAVAL